MWFWLIPCNKTTWYNRNQHVTAWFTYLVNFARRALCMLLINKCFLVVMVTPSDWYFMLDQVEFDFQYSWETRIVEVLSVFQFFAASLLDFSHSTPSSQHVQVLFLFQYCSIFNISSFVTEWCRDCELIFFCIIDQLFVLMTNLEV